MAALAQSLLVLFALLAVAGLSNAVTQPAINLFMADQVPLDRQGLAFGIKQSAIPAAVLVSGLALPLIALPFGWRADLRRSVRVAALAVARWSGGSAAQLRRAAAARAPAPRPSRALLFTGRRAPRSASAGPNSLGTYLVASAVDVGIAEGAAGVLAAVGSAVSLLTRMAFGAARRPPARLRLRHGRGAARGRARPASLLMTIDSRGARSWPATVVAFALGWGWPGLFNLAVVDHNREAPARGHRRHPDAGST